MSFAIRTDKFEIKGQCSIPSFNKRAELMLVLITSAVEMTLKYCEELSEDELGGDYVDWKDQDEIVSAFLDTGLFSKWAEKVAFDLGESAVQIPD